MADQTLTHIVVKNEQAREHGTFFVVEGCEQSSNGATHYWAQLTCNTPFGMVGTFFGSMGAPAAEFLRRCNKGYILGRLWGLQTKVYDGAVAERELRKLILRDRYAVNLTAEKARELWDAVEGADFEEEHGFRTLVYDNAHFYQQFSEGGCIDYKVPNPQAEGFWELLWPGFLAVLAQRAETAAKADETAILCTYSHGPVWDAFGISRAAYLVVPRRTLQSMPLEWQQRFVALMDEAHAHLPAEAFPDYVVQRRERGRFLTDPLRDYRHTGPIAPKDSANG